MEETLSARTDRARRAPDELRQERLQRVLAAIDLQKPGCIPLVMWPGYWPAELGGISRQELQDNVLLASQLVEQLALRYEPDMIARRVYRPEMSQILGDTMTRYPGHGLGADGAFQFVEQELMKAEDYDDFLEDPDDWAVRRYLPRAFGALEGLSELPPLGLGLLGFYGMIENLSVVASPRVMSALQALTAAACKLKEGADLAARLDDRMAALGFPPLIFSGKYRWAPFDFMGSTLRGMRGVMLDMLRRPDKLLAAEDKVRRIQTRDCLDWAQATGNNIVAFALHRGSDGFMSLPQFERFYWPQLRDMLLELIDHGLIPWVLYEGIWDKRLRYLAELPKGKSIGWFQSSDLFRVKEVLGDTMCIMGGMPASLLQAGTVADVRRHTREVCEVVGSGGGFIMSTVISEMEGSRPELVEAWVNATREYGEY